MCVDVKKEKWSSSSIGMKSHVNNLIDKLYYTIFTLMLFYVLLLILKKKIKRMRTATLINLTASKRP